MHTTELLVTPNLAAELLASGPNARFHAAGKIVDDRRVGAFSRMLRDGSFKTTFQGIAIDSNGVLIDGFHRLSAICQTGISHVLRVTYGCPPEHKDLADQGAKRGNECLMRCSRHHADINSFLVNLATGCSAPTPLELSAGYVKTGPIIDALLAKCSTTRKKFTTARIRGACVVAYGSGFRDAFTIYKAGATLDNESMKHPSVPAYIRAIEASVDFDNAMLRAWLSFTRKASSKVVMISQKEVRAEFRAACKALLGI